METPNKLPTVGDSSVEKTLRDIEDGIFDLSVEVQEGFNKTCKYYNLFDSHLDNIHEYLYSIQTILEKSFSLSQTQQQENQLALMRAKAEEPEKEKDKEDKKVKDGKEIPKNWIMGVLGILGFTIGAIGSLVYEYFSSKIKLFMKMFNLEVPLNNFFRRIKISIWMIRKWFNKNLLEPIFDFSKSVGDKFDNIKKSKTFSKVSNFFTYVGQKFDDIKNSVIGTFGKIKGSVTEFTTFISESFQTFKTFLSDNFDFFKKNEGLVSKYVTPVIDYLFGFFTFIGKGFKWATKFLKAAPVIGQIFGLVVDFFIGIYKAWSDGKGILDILIGGAFQVIAGFFGGIPDLIFNLLNYISKWVFGFDMRSIIGDFSLEKALYDWLFVIWDFLWNDLFSADTWRTVGELLSGLWKDIKYAFNDLSKWFGTKWENLKTDLFLYWQIIKFEFLNIWYSVSDWFGTKWETLKTDLGVVWQDLKTMFTGLFSKTSEWLGTKWETLKTDLSLVWKDLKKKFGIESLISSIMESVSGFFTKFSEMFSVSNLLGMLLETAKSLGAPSFIIDWLNGKVKGEEIKSKEKQFDKALGSGDLKEASKIRKSLLGVVSDEKFKELGNKLVAGIKAEKLSKTLESTQNKNNEMKDKNNQSQPQVVTDQSVRQVNNNSRSTTVYQTQKDEEPLPRTSMGGYLQPSM